ncbi:hypothetical protein F4861DRAFT_538862 [Xylaria intraflava]|nr:hypothetical protein F4861DRAFT_538862 [Xylaria intraflava]
MRLSLAPVFCLLVPTLACYYPRGEVPATLPRDYSAVIKDNIHARSLNRRQIPSQRVALTNVRVFDGSCLQPPSTVYIENGRISQCVACEGGNCPPAETYDGQGMTLLPGLIDAHAHPMNVTNLEDLAKAGVTTAVNAFCPAPPLCASLKNHTGLTSLVTASFLATAPGSEHAMIVGPLGAPYLIHNASQAGPFVAQQVKQGADFIKMIGSAPETGLTQAEQNALVAASHKAGKQVILHAPRHAAYVQGLLAGADQIHHSTLDTPIDDRVVDMFKKNRNTIVCPTLVAMRAIVEQIKPANETYDSAVETVTKLHEAGVTILAGTDSFENGDSAVQAEVPFGSSLHDELENLVAAGLSPVEALNAATINAARHFGLADRAVIREGMRADLLLVRGDPTVNISATRDIAGIWIGGVQVKSQ